MDLEPPNFFGFFKAICKFCGCCSNNTTNISKDTIDLSANSVFVKSNYQGFDGISNIETIVAPKSRYLFTKAEFGDSTFSMDSIDGYWSLSDIILRARNKYPDFENTFCRYENTQIFEYFLKFCDRASDFLLEGHLLEMLSFHPMITLSLIDVIFNCTVFNSISYNDFSWFLKPDTVISFILHWENTIDPVCHFKIELKELINNKWTETDHWSINFDGANQRFIDLLQQVFIQSDIEDDVSISTKSSYIIKNHPINDLHKNSPKVYQNYIFIERYKNQSI